MPGSPFVTSRSTPGLAASLPPLGPLIIRGGGTWGAPPPSPEDTASTDLPDLTRAMRNHGLPVAPTSMAAWIEIDGIEYAAVKVAVRNSRMDVKAMVDLAVGTSARDTHGRKAVPASFRFVRGTPAKVWVEVDRDVVVEAPEGPEDTLLREGKHCLIDGVIDDGGPGDLADGVFNLRCVIVSKMIYLATGATHFTAVRAAHLDTSELTGVSLRDYVTPIDLDVARDDFWLALQNLFIEYLSAREFSPDVSDRIAKFLDFVGGNPQDLPQTAINALKTIGGALPGGIFADTDMARVVTQYIARQFHRDLSQQSIYAQLQAMAEDFFFAVVENGNGVAVVPWTPLVHSSECKPIWPATVLQSQWVTHDSGMMSGLVFIDNPYGSMFTPSQESATDFVLGGFRRRGVEGGKNDIDVAGDALGLFTPLPGPSWMHVRSNAQGDLHRPTTSIDTSVVREYASPYAREVALRYNYRGRMVMVRCPFRLDVGPCTPVKIVFPGLAGTGIDESVAVFGSVETVTLTLSAAEKRAATEMEVMYARSTHQQSTDIDERPLDGFGGPQDTWGSTKGFHPLWSHPYLGNRLDEEPRSLPDIPG